MLSDPERVEDLVDPRLGDSFPFEDLLKVATIALACVHPDPARRPHMGEVSPRGIAPAVGGDCPGRRTVLQFAYNGVESLAWKCAGHDMVRTETREKGRFWTIVSV